MSFLRDAAIEACGDSLSQDGTSAGSNRAYESPRTKSPRRSARAFASPAQAPCAYCAAVGAGGTGGIGMPGGMPGGIPGMPGYGRPMPGPPIGMCAPKPRII